MSGNYPDATGSCVFKTKDLSTQIDTQIRNDLKLNESEIITDVYEDYAIGKSVFPDDGLLVWYAQKINGVWTVVDTVNAVTCNSPQLFPPSLVPNCYPSTSSTKFDLSICPFNGWLNCMPIVDRQRAYQCQDDFINWAKSNCPNFQGVAY